MNAKKSHIEKPVLMTAEDGVLVLTDGALTLCADFENMQPRLTKGRLNSELITVEELIAGYAIVTIPENLIDSFTGLEEIEYVEKPKRLFFISFDNRIVKNWRRCRGVDLTCLFFFHDQI